MQHETKMENQSWLKKLARRLGPGHVVNLCFIVVLLFSTLLTWREVVVLEDAYISSQRNHLENVANALDKHLQYNVDKLIFLRNGMREALVAPLDFTSLRNFIDRRQQGIDIDADLTFCGIAVLFCGFHHLSSQPLLCCCGQSLSPPGIS